MRQETCPPQTGPSPPGALLPSEVSASALLPEYLDTPPQAHRRASWWLIDWLQLLSAARATLNISRPPVRVTAGLPPT